MKILHRHTKETIFECKRKTIKTCLVEAVKNKVDLSYADLSNADLRGADLSNADLWDADLSNANLRGANLSNADLRGADLSNADLRGANLSNANLSYADLSNANLSYADLSNADLWGEKITKCPIYISAPRWDVWITNKRIKIGCQIHATKAWEKFTDEQISKMDDDALEFWKVWKEPILAMAKAHQESGEE